MKIDLIRQTFNAGILLPVVLLSACSLWPFGGDDRPDYYGVEDGQPLEVPPDLSNPANDPTMHVPAVNGAPLAVESEPPDDPTPPALSSPSVPLRPLPRSEEGVPYLVLEDSLASAWRRTGLALERSGFTIGERDDTRWLYSIVYLAPVEEDDDDGFFGWLFGDDDAESEVSGEYQVSLVGDGEQRTRVMVLDEAGNPVDTKAAAQILSLLADRLLI